MSTPTFLNKFGSSVIKGNFANDDYIDASGSVVTEAYGEFKRNVAIQGDLILGNETYTTVNTYDDSGNVTGSEIVYTTSGGNITFMLKGVNYVITPSMLKNVTTLTDDISNSLSNEMDRAISSEEFIYTQLSSEISRAVSNDIELTNTLSNEIARATTTELELSQIISNHYEHSLSVESVLSTSISGEVSRAISNENMINTQVSNEIARATLTENILSTSLSNEVSRAISNENMINTQVSNEASRATLTENVLSISLSNEIYRATSADVSLTNTISTVYNTISQLTSGGPEIIDNLNNEISRANSAEVLINASLLTEVSRALSAEKSLSSAIINTVANISISESSLSVAISGEIGRAIISANTTIVAIVTNETFRATSAEVSISAILSNAISNAVSSDISLYSLISGETARATSNEGVLSTALSNEVSRAITSDISLSTIIKSEVSRATSNESSISSQVSAEVFRANSAESLINTSLTNEISRATQSETLLSSAISNEVIRATTADTSLQSGITGEVTRATSVESVLSTTISNEILRAIVADNSLTTSILNEVSRAIIADRSLSTGISQETVRAVYVETQIYNELSNCVKLDNNQTITGEKVFTGDVYFLTPNGLENANNEVLGTAEYKTLISATNTYVYIATIALSSYQKQNITFTTPISVYRTGNTLAFTVTDTLSSISCYLYRNAVYYQTLTVTTNNALPISKSYSKPPILANAYEYQQYFTNASVEFTPQTEAEAVDYTLYFRLAYSSVSPPPTAVFGFYLNTNISTGTATSNLAISSPNGIGYQTANFSVNYDNITINQNGALFSNHVLSNEVYIKRLNVLQHRVSNYDSGWFAVSSNSVYDLTHNLGWSFPNPPFIRAFFSTTASPILGTNNIYEISVNSMSGLYNGADNYQYGISHIRHITSNQLRISTPIRGVYYSRGGEDVANYTAGYFRIIMYR